MKFKIIFFISLVMNQAILNADRVEEFNAYWENLKRYGETVKVCLDMQQQNLLVDQRGKAACAHSYRMYLGILAEYYDFLGASKK